jgi:hypothetical protein
MDAAELAGTGPVGSRPQGESRCFWEGRGEDWMADGEVGSRFGSTATYRKRRSTARGTARPRFTGGAWPYSVHGLSPLTTGGRQWTHTRRVMRRSRHRPAAVS